MPPEINQHGKRHHSRRTRSRRVIVGLAVVLVVLLVAGLFWLLTSPAFVKPR
jgi:type VI protein secretion system component VasF